MPRPLRTFADGGIYHIIDRGNGRQRIFHKDGDYVAFLKLLGEVIERHGIELYAYCVMPNHFHLLLEAGQGENVSIAMQWFLTTHVRRYHQHYHSSGHLWQGRFKSFGVQRDEYLTTVARYIEGNPVRAGLVETAVNWVWSSHRGRCGIEHDLLIQPLPVPWVGDWTHYVDTPLTSSDLAKVRNKRQSKRDVIGGFKP
ncbi:REP-associated tyrosine transposase [Geomonas propionica]|uniref:Transposase n=1 Tax=Geomonas propionica TaxID=2798582 RepID=A0ABS0YXU7_9BACT|nr:transposase [Geomonas propionica]MBJ6802801.1 transposase [Geomonas propionica]